jgi:16S rRNA (cytosine967-C5)-methyltransferase
MPPVGAPAATLAEYYSHPLWLVQRWLGTFGDTATHALLDWNQRPAPIYARSRGYTIDVNDDEEVSKGLSPLLRATGWPDYFEVGPGRWADVQPLLKSGRLYVQDPSARHAVELLAPRPGEWVLDACAAPGGKSLLIADALALGVRQAPFKSNSDDKGPEKDINGELALGGLVALDLPGERMERLKENLVHVGEVKVVLVPADLRSDPALMLRGQEAPVSYPAVLVDAPCTNSGVMRHRVDVKWRLQKGDFHRHAQQQLVLLQAAARLVAPGGRLVYSTCSIDPEENEDVVAAFLKGSGGAFTLAGQVLSKPWEADHDGGGAFLLRRSG